MMQFTQVLHFSLGILSTYGSVHNFVFNFILLYDITSTVIESLFCNVQVILILNLHCKKSIIYYSITQLSLHKYSNV